MVLGKCVRAEVRKLSSMLAAACTHQLALNWKSNLKSRTCSAPRKTSTSLDAVKYSIQFL